MDHKHYLKIGIKSLNEMKEDQKSDDVKKAVEAVRKLAEICEAKTPIKTTNTEKTIGQFSIQGGMLDYTETKTTEGELIITDSQDFSYDIYITYEHVYEDKSTFSDQTGPEADGNSIIVVSDAAVTYEDNTNSLTIMVTEEFSKQVEKILYYLNDKTVMKTESNEPVQVSSLVKRLSDEGLLSILKDHDHVHIFGDESREELEQILQLNLDDDLIDEIEVITVLNGEQ